MVTVTFDESVVERVAVIVKDDPAFSAMDEALIDSVTAAALSSSVIVIVAVCVPLSVAEPPDTPVMAITADSFPSDVLSLVGV